MAHCYLHSPPEPINDELIYDHVRLRHADVCTHVERCPDGEVVVTADAALTDRDYHAE